MSNKKKRKITTVDKINYEMLFAGKTRVFDKVTISIDPDDGHEMMSILEIERLALIVRDEVLSNDEPLVVGEVRQILALYHLKKDDLFENNIIDYSESSDFKNWYNVLSVAQSRKIKDYFRSLTLPERNM